MENEGIEGKENFISKMILENSALAHVSKLQPGTHYIFKIKDGRIAQCKCVDLDGAHSARGVYLNSRTARDRLIVSIVTAFDFVFLYLYHLCSM